MIGKLHDMERRSRSSFSTNTLLRVVAVFVLVALAVVGCGRLDLTGTPQANQKPELIFVNVPAGGTQFSANPTVYWYGTDVDGRVIRYDYAVIPETTVERLLIEKGCPSGALTPERFIECADDDDYRWTSIFVDSASATLPTQDRINLFAAFDTLACDSQVRQIATPDSVYFVTEAVNCVSNTINQFMFVRAIDDLDSSSDIKYRSYLRTNHWPDTEIDREFINNSLRFPYFSLPKLTSAYRGIAATWRGTDRQDYVREEPPIQYYWRVIGPFDSPPTLADTLLPNGQRRKPVQESKSRILEDGVWIADTIGYMYDLWRDVDAAGGASDTTRTGYFGLVVTARDDAFVPDPSPAFSYFRAIEPKFERDVLVITQAEWRQTVYGSPTCGTSPSVASDPSCCQNFLIDIAEQAIAPLTSSGWDFNKDWMEVNSENPDPRQGYVGCRSFTTPERPRCFPQGPTLDELARHRLTIYEHEDIEVPLGPATLTALSQYLDIGGMMWLIDRTPFIGQTQVGSIAKLFDYATVSGFNGVFPRRYFDIEGMWFPGWREGIIKFPSADDVESNDEFIGASIVGNVPLLPARLNTVPAKIDSTYVFTYRDVLESRNPPEHILGVPAVPYIFRGSKSRTLYRYISWRPDQNIAHGQPIAIRFVGPTPTEPVFKTAWFGCPLYYLERQDAYDFVAGMTDWFLNQPLEAGT